ncbi:thiol-disulfide oxidoreductase DCC family protein [Chryseobacterium sp. JUb7]|uniref:thiol-disulfide oxidoreductase DCC family protein n=1 Tax=Chryseobacterium sp. JUb7 TaxID=2940599 RepID=UPI002166EAE4|nr:DCC1-like thiol-disulfide oxidoreductase family protein [Chryseobacterium sp. JUb7]MCS3530810.1 putative DCC family thiol-disulfide oxidoreductase YuxK [Chryseobacterium sp. JUb7]
MKTIIYDSECKFCTRFSTWSQSKVSSIEILSVRSKESRKILREKGVKFVDLQTVYFIDHDEVLVRSRAVFRVFSNFRFPWKFVSYFKFLPLQVTDFAYKLFAKYRYYF